MSVQAKWKNRKSIVSSSQRELDKRIKAHERRGWRKVGKGAEVHGAYKTEYIQVME